MLGLVADGRVLESEEIADVLAGHVDDCVCVCVCVYVCVYVCVCVCVCEE